MTEITVTQEDREVAANWMRALSDYQEIGAGGYGDLVQAFARHRHEARKTALEEAAGIADAYSDMCAGSDQPETQGACSGAAGAATAIRSAIA